MLSVLYFVWVWARVGANSLFRFILEQSKYIEYRHEKNEYQSLMNIFVHFKDLDKQCTQQTILNTLFLLIMNQFQCYYHQCDHYLVRPIERVVMHFFKKCYTPV